MRRGANGDNWLEQLPVADRVTVLRIGRRRDPRLGVAVARVQIAHPADADACREQLRDGTSAPPESGIRRRTSRAGDAVGGSASPLSTRNSARIGDVVDGREPLLPVVGVHERPAESARAADIWRKTVIPASSSGGKISLYPGLRLTLGPAVQIHHRPDRRRRLPVAGTATPVKSNPSRAVIVSSVRRIRGPAGRGSAHGRCAPIPVIRGSTSSTVRGMSTGPRPSSRPSTRRR